MDVIKSSTEISELFARGKRLSTPFLTLIYAPEKNEGAGQHDRHGRVAFIAGKKSGNAVWRNSAKRRMRALCRELNGPWTGYDVIFLAKSSVTRASYSKVLTVCAKVVERSELVSERD